MTKNSNLHKAKSEKNDEFYTQLDDIAKEMNYYTDYFKGKVVYCNCDNPINSNFTKYFILKFHSLGLKKLICTFYDIHNTKKAYAFEYNGEDMNGDGIIDCNDIEEIRRYRAFQTPLADDDGFDWNDIETCNSKGIYGSGDFRSKHCIEYLKMSDIVVTNPPFSLFREYVAQLMEYRKKFIIIGNGNAVTYKEIFPLIKENKIWIGASKGIGGKFTFIVPETYNGKFVSEVNGVRIGQVNNACWFTNMEHNKRHTPLNLYKKYNPIDYPKYDNYDAIDSRTDEIPMDYDGVIGVPITFLDKYCPTQFEIIKFRKGDDDKDLSVNGKCPYFRILIKRK